MREPGQIKRAHRVATFQRATLVLENGDERSVLVTDLSSGGFKIEPPDSLAAGDQIHLRVDRYGDFAGEIIWADRDHAGGRFLTPIALD